MVTAKIILDNRRENSDKLYYAKIRITSNRRSKYYSAYKKKLSDEEFDRIMNAKRRTDDEKKIYSILTNLLSKANSCIDNLKLFTFYGFEELYFQIRGALDNLNDAFEKTINELNTEGRLGTAGSYSSAKISINKFKPGLKFADVNPKLLTKYESWMISEGKSYATIGIYLRPLRALFRTAIRNKIIDYSIYPFGPSKDGKYEIPTGRNKKKALHLDDLTKLYYYEPKNSNRQTAKDFWKFSYLCNGLNIKDILNLKQKDVKGEYIHYLREKTKRTKKDKEPIVISLKNDAKDIILKYGKDNHKPDDYIFPIYDLSMTAEQQFKIAYNFTRFINKNLAKICKEIGLSEKITTYSARHSFATTLKRNHADLELIRESLGHSDIKTTQKYLDSFENEVLKTTTDLLIPQRV